VAVRLAGRGMNPTEVRSTAPALAVNSPPRPLAARRLCAPHRSSSHGAFTLRIVAVEQANELSCLGASALTDHDNVHAASQEVAAKAARPAHLVYIRVPVEEVAVLADPVQILHHPQGR